MIFGYISPTFYQTIKKQNTQKSKPATNQPAQSDRHALGYNGLYYSILYQA